MATLYEDEKKSSEKFFFVPESTVCDKAVLTPHDENLVEFMGNSDSSIMTLHFWRKSGMK